jgi:hypothetical protein
MNMADSPNLKPGTGALDGSRRVFGFSRVLAGRVRGYMLLIAILALGALLAVSLVSSRDVQHASRYEPMFYVLATIMIVSGLGYAIFSYALAIRLSASSDRTSRGSAAQSRRRLLVGLGVLATFANGVPILFNGHANVLQVALAALLIVALWIVNRRWPQ